MSVPEGTDHCCSGILTATVGELPLWQEIPFGTTAWRISYGRRNAVESSNGGLKGSFVNLSGKRFFRVFGLAKITLLLGFAIAAFNFDRARSFLASVRATEEASAGAQTRRPPRVGIWQDVLPPAAEERIAGPP